MLTLFIFLIYFFFHFKTVDDWKQKRRQKKNFPSTSRLTQLGEEEYDDNKPRRNNKRINKFEHSHHYVTPLDGDLNKVNNSINENQKENANQYVKNENNENNTVNFNPSDLNNFMNSKRFDYLFLF